MNSRFARRTESPFRSHVHLFTLAVLAVVGGLTATSHAQIFVTSANTFADGEAFISEYDTNTGAVINASLVTNSNVAFSMARVGSKLYTSNNNLGTVTKYTTSGIEESQTFIGDLSGPLGMVAAGNSLFVFNDFSDTIGVYDAATGAAINPALITGVENTRHLAYSEGYLYVPGYLSGSVDKYNASTGELVTPNLVTGLSNPTGIAVAGGHLYVVNEGDSTLGKYDATSGATINAALITDLSGPLDMAVLNDEIYVLKTSANSIGKYTTSGAEINASFVTNLPPFSLAFVVSSPEPTDGELFVSNAGSFQDGQITIGKYDLAGVPIDSSLITDSNVAFGMALAGDSLFTSNNNLGTISKYTLSGGSVNPAYIAGLSGPMGIAVAGNTLYVVSDSSGTVGTYTADTGAVINAALVTGLNVPRHVAVSAGYLYVTHYIDGIVGKYDVMTGAAVNAALITGLNHPTGIAVEGGSVFVGNESNGTVGKYDAVTGEQDLAFDISAAGTIEDIQMIDGNLYVLDFGGRIGKYTTAGAVVNANLITGLAFPLSMAIGTHVCNTPTFDLNGDGLVDGLDISSYVRCQLVASLPGDNCAAAGELTPEQLVDAVLAGEIGGCP